MEELNRGQWKAAELKRRKVLQVFIPFNLHRPLSAAIFPLPKLLLISFSFASVTSVLCKSLGEITGDQSLALGIR